MYRRSIRIASSGFTLVELLVGMTIFAIGLTAIYALLASTMKNASYSRHEIVAANLMRESIELLKYGRDTNIKNFIPWDSALIKKNGSYEYRLFSWAYLVENNFSQNGVKISPTDGKILESGLFLESIETPLEDTGAIWQKARLYKDSEWRYTHAVTSTGTPYALYTTLSPIAYTEWWSIQYVVSSDGLPDGYIIHTNFLIQTMWRYRHYDVKSAITNWIR